MGEKKAAPKTTRLVDAHARLDVVPYKGQRNRFCRMGQHSGLGKLITSMDNNFYNLSTVGLDLASKQGSLRREISAQREIFESRHLFHTGLPKLLKSVR